MNGQRAWCEELGAESKVLSIEIVDRNNMNLEEKIFGY